ncbi:MAG: proton-conducting transporter membrane subunit, partial [Pseudomonadota bacterium]
VFAAASSREQEGCSGSLAGLVKAGVLTSVLTILGAAFLFGTVGSTDLWEIAGRLQEVLHAERGSVPITAKAGYVVAIGLLFSGMLLRMEAFPFHGWTCRTHASIRIPFASFLSAFMKTGAFAAALRILWILFIRHSREYEENFPLIAIISTVAVLTVLAGTWKAFFEKDFRKFMACSCVAHTGLLLMGVSLCGRQGIEPVMVYLGIYAVMTFGAFFIFGAAGGRSPGAGLDVLSGLHGRSPVLAGSMTVILLSLTGVPVTGGFMAKYLLFQALLGHSKPLFHIVAAIGIAASVLSAVTYGRIIHGMYFKPGPETSTAAPAAVRPPVAAAVVALMVAAVLIATGVYWKPLQQAAVSAMMIIEFQY